MKKVLFYIHSLNKGGAERVLLTVATRLKNEYEVVILTDKHDEREYELPEGIKRIDIETELKSSGKSNSTVWRLIFLRKACKREKADCIIAFMASSAMRAIVANMFSFRKVVAAVRSNPYDDFGSGINRRKINYLFGKTKAVVCQTEYQAQFFDKKVQKKCTVIINPLFDEFKNTSYEGTRTNRIVATGRLFDYKNHELMIRAFKKIADKYPDYVVEIFGEGPYRPQLTSIIEECGLEEKVLLSGDSSKVAEDIKDATMYVLPSDTEGMPNALMEAMALGLPVISTDCPCGGPKTLIEEGVNGLLVPVGDVDAMSKAMDRLLSDEDLRKSLSKNAKEILNRCDIEKIASLWGKVIEK